MRRQSWWHVVSVNAASTGHERHVLTVLSHHATRNGYVGLPRGMMAELVGCTEWKIRSALKKLVSLRDVRLAWRGKGRKNDVYQIIVPAIKEVNTTKYRVRIVEVPPVEEFPPLRLMEKPSLAPKPT